MSGRGPLHDKRIVLGVTGSIACYKAADAASKLTQAGALVDVILTDSAQRFVSALTFRSLTGRPVVTDMFDVESEVAEEHVALARRADAMLIAPATATTIARLAHGLADDMVALTALATTAPVLVAPAMDSQMWENAATRGNVETLRARGVEIVGPTTGRLASGHDGAGRLVDTDTLVGAVRRAVGRNGTLAGRRIVVSAGGTHEPVDPVRFIGNRSSGKMGFAIAEAARDRGAHVTLVTGPVALPTPYGIERIDVRTTAEMREAVCAAVRGCDAVIMAAAPADFRPADPAGQKIKRTDQVLTLRLEPNDDIIAGLHGDFVKVGFAAETHELLAHAREKIEKKGLDLIVANDVSASDAGFATDTNRVTLITHEGRVDEYPLMAKYDVASQIVGRVAALIDARRGRQRPGTSDH